MKKQITQSYETTVRSQMLTQLPKNGNFKKNSLWDVIHQYH
jgi:hypothetical protein